MKDSTVKIDKAVVEDLNGKSWKEFLDTVMLMGVDQEVEGMLIYCAVFRCKKGLFKKSALHLDYRAIPT